MSGLYFVTVAQIDHAKLIADDRIMRSANHLTQEGRFMDRVSLYFFELDFMRSCEIIFSLTLQAKLLHQMSVAISWRELQSLLQTFFRLIKLTLSQSDSSFFHQGR